MNWKHALKDYGHFLRIERGLANNTIVNYSHDIQKLHAYLEENEISVSPIAISEEVLQQFIYEISKKVNARSQSRIISGLKSFFNFLIFEDYRKDNPVELIESPKIGRKLPNTLSTKEIDQLISAVDLGKAEGERNRAIIETLYGCGLRVSELTELRISDLFFDEGFIRVTGKGNKQRYVPIARHTQKFIELYLTQVRVHSNPKRESGDIIFLNRRGGKLSRAMIFTIIKKLCEKAELNKNVSPHTFRHSFATHLMENGADLRAIQQMLGHESITTTEIYMHMDRSHLKQVINEFHPRRKK